MDEYKWLTVTNADNKKLTRFIHPKICVDNKGKLVQNQWVEPQIKYLCELKDVDLIDKLENDDEKRTGYPIHPYLLVEKLLDKGQITVPDNGESRKFGFFDFSDNSLTEAEQAQEGFMKDEGAAAGAGGGDIMYREVVDINHKFKIDKNIKVKLREDEEEMERPRRRRRQRRSQPRITEEDKETLEQLIRGDDNFQYITFRWNGQIPQILMSDTDLPELKFIDTLLHAYRWSLEYTGEIEEISGADGATSAAGSEVHVYNINKLPDEE